MNMLPGCSASLLTVIPCTGVVVWAIWLPFGIVAVGGKDSVLAYPFGFRFGQPVIVVVAVDGGIFFRADYVHFNTVA